MKRTIVLSIAALALAGCSAKSALVNRPTATVGTTATTDTTPQFVAHVGDLLSLPGQSGATAAVTLVAVTDPAQADVQPFQPAAGKRFVSATFTILDTGPAITGDANNDATLIGSDGQTYTADFDTLAGCTNFAHGVYQLGHGESSTGCVAFQVPIGVTVSKVKYSPDSGFSGDFGEWLVP